MKTAFLASVVYCIWFTSLASAQDFQREYTLPGGSGISIRNVAGNIDVTGYDGASIVVTAWKKGRDRDLVTIIDASSEDYINVYVEYPRCGNVEASVEFDVRVPAGMQYGFDDITSVSGDVSLTSTTGPIHAQSVSGRVEIRDFLGNANASSVSGDVFVQITRDPGAAIMKFTSVSGDVTALAPVDLDAYVDLSTLSGTIWTTFPIRMSGRWPFWGRSARGRLGHGTANLKVSTVSGRISLLADR